ncbi:MAG: NADPH-dependent F420 reductase [bacterium]
MAAARNLSLAGYEVVISNSRGAESLSALAKSLGSNVKAGSVPEVGRADVVFLAVPWNHLKQAVSAVPSWQERIVIDPTNPIVMPGFQLADLGGKTSSEVVAELVPGGKLVKAFNTLTPALLAANPREAGGQRVIFFSGNDASAKTIVAGIINKIGFAGIDLGELSGGGKLQQFPGGPLPTLNLIKLG